MTQLHLDDIFLVRAKQLGWGVSKEVPPRYYDSEKSVYVKKFWTQFKTVYL